MSDEARVIDVEFVEEKTSNTPPKKRPVKFEAVANEVADVCDAAAKPVDHFRPDVAGQIRETAKELRGVGERIDDAIASGKEFLSKAVELGEKAKAIRSSPILRRRF